MKRTVHARAINSNAVTAAALKNGGAVMAGRIASIIQMKAHCFARLSAAVHILSNVTISGTYN